jgi:hypothetical protein
VPTGRNTEHVLLPRTPNLSSDHAQTTGLSSAPSAAPSTAQSHAGPAREQSLVQLGVSDEDHSPRLPESFREGEEESVKLTKELTKNLNTLDAFQDKLNLEEKNLGVFFKEQVLLS